MQRVVHLLPTHREIAELTEVTVAEHLGAEVAELDIEAEASSEFARQGIEHDGEELLMVYVVLALGILVVVALTVDAALCEDVGWKQRTASAH